MAVRRFPTGLIREREFYATLHRLRQERATAPKIVDHALRRTPIDQWNTLQERPEFLTAGAIEHIGKLLDASMGRNPTRAHALSLLALSFAETLPADSYPPVILAQIRATAWKDVGKVLSYLARHTEADRAFDEAERHVEPYAALEHDHAIIQLNRAINYIESNRPHEALPILAYCKEVFSAHADNGLFILSGFYEGRLHHESHHYREAREIYLLLIASASNIPKATLAALHQSIGLCSTELGDYAAAEDNLRKGIELHIELGQLLDAVKGDHARGMLLLRRGYPKHALAVLRVVRHQYLKNSLAEEAGLSGLRMVEALLTLGEFDKADRLARTIMSEFLAASLSTRALTALGYLTEAIASQKASPAVASHVYDYVLSLRKEPEREYEQPTLPRDAG